MSGPLETRVWKAHPLAPAHRLLLLAVAREVPDGQTEVLVNRALLARTWDANAGLVTAALRAGEDVGLCRVLRTGRVAFSAYDAPLGAPERPPAPPSAVRTATPLAAGEVVPDRPTHGQVMAEFAKQWAGTYKQQYIFTAGKDHRLARTLASAMPLTDLSRRVAVYLTHENPFYSECAHAFGVFAQRVNEFTGRRPVAAPARTSGPRVLDADASREYMKRQREAGRDGGATSGGPTGRPVPPAQSRGGESGARSAAGEPATGRPVAVRPDA